MADNKQKASTDQGISPLAAGVVGAAVGAAVVGTAAILSNPDNRDAINEKVEEVKDKGDQVMDYIKKTTSDGK